MIEHFAKRLPHVKDLRLHSLINVQSKTTAHTIIQNPLQNAHYTPLHYYITVKPYLQR